MNETTNSTELETNRPPRGKFGRTGCFVLLLAGPIVLMIVVGAGQINGVEFSPDDFSRRSFSYNRIPWFNLTLRKNVHEDLTGAAEKHLIASGLIPAVTSPPVNWHLVNDSKTPRNSPDFDAKILCEYLDMKDDNGNSYWARWSIDHPGLAAVFWPVVARMAREEMYLGLPDVMRFAMNHGTEKVIAFEDGLHPVVARQYLEIGRIDLELGRHSRAAKRLLSSLDFEETVEARRLLREAQSAEKDSDMQTRPSQ